MNTQAKSLTQTQEKPFARKQRSIFAYALFSCGVFALVLLAAMYSLDMLGMNKAERRITDWYDSLSAKR